MYASLLSAMVLGRIALGIAQLLLLTASGNAFTFTAFLNGANLSAVPGILVQIVLIPVLVLVLKRAKLMLN